MRMKLNNFDINIFGESHSEYIGVSISNLKAGIKLNIDSIKNDLSKRRPKLNVSTKRKELDEFKIISGFKDGFTTGATLTVLIINNKMNSKEYIEGVIRPGHADYSSYIKYNGFNDSNGGGIFSGRLTVALVFAGSIFKELLKNHNIFIGSNISKAKEFEDYKLNNITKDELIRLSNSNIPLVNSKLELKLLEYIQSIKDMNDTLGGIIKTYVINLPIGLGEPIFNSIESQISSILFSIGSIKGVTFGEGYEFSNLLGSESNDELEYVDNIVKYKSNKTGGIIGGLTNGEPLIINSIFKPISSINKEQNTINIIKKENIIHKINGRHDAFILDRACVVINNSIAIVLYDLLIEKLKKDNSL